MEQTIKAIIRRIEKEPSLFELYEDFFERFTYLSQWQKQQLAIAHAMIADKPVRSVLYRAGFYFDRAQKYKPIKLLP